MLQFPHTRQTQTLRSSVVEFDVHEIALRSTTEFSSSIWSLLPGSYQTQAKSLHSQTPAAGWGRRTEKHPLRFWGQDLTLESMLLKLCVLRRTTNWKNIPLLPQCSFFGQLTHAGWRLACNICCSNWSISWFCRDRKLTVGLQPSAGNFLTF